MVRVLVQLSDDSTEASWYLDSDGFGQTYYASYRAKERVGTQRQSARSLARRAEPSQSLLGHTEKVRHTVLDDLTRFV